MCRRAVLWRSAGVRSTMGSDVPSRALWAVPDHGACSASETAGREVLAAISCLGWQRVFLTQQELTQIPAREENKFSVFHSYPVPGCGGCLCFKSGGPGLWLGCWVTSQLVGLFGKVASLGFPTSSVQLVWRFCSLARWDPAQQESWRSFGFCTERTSLQDALIWMGMHLWGSKDLHQRGQTGLLKEDLSLPSHRGTRVTGTFKCWISVKIKCKPLHF